ncbi:MAG: hypothetical protein RMK92_01340 [Armatimonadota bacterium]|nr:hypothetical protein [Armatimonadota bacterium]
MRALHGKRLRGTLYLLVWLAQTAWGQGVPREQAFPIESLPVHLQAQAEAVFLRLMDREGLYTVIGGMKPMSSAFVTLAFDPSDEKQVAQLDTLRQILRTFRCGEELYADMMVFQKAQNGKKVAHGIVVNRESLRATIRQYASFFASLGITEHSHPMEVVMAVEYAPRAQRHRGYGYLFGYPKYAVDFFVQAGDEEEATGRFVQRDFVHIPTFERETNLFVWAVPKGHQENEEDQRIRRLASRILASYKARRARYIGKDKPGIAQLLRDWLDDSTGQCSLLHARFAASIPLFPEPPRK